MDDNKKYLTTPRSYSTYTRTSSNASNNSAPVIKARAQRSRSTRIPTAAIAPQTVSTGVSTSMNQNSLHGVNNYGIEYDGQGGLGIDSSNSVGVMYATTGRTGYSSGYRRTSSMRTSSSAEPVHRPMPAFGNYLYDDEQPHHMTSSPLNRFHHQPPNQMLFDHNSPPQQHNVTQSASSGYLSQFNCGSKSNLSGYNRTTSEDDLYRQDFRMDFLERKIRELEGKLPTSSPYSPASSTSGGSSHAKENPLEVTINVQHLRDQLNEVSAYKNKEIERWNAKYRKARLTIDSDRKFFMLEVSKLKKELDVRDNEIAELLAQLAKCDQQSGSDRAETPMTSVSKIGSLPSLTNQEAGSNNYSNSDADSFSGRDTASVLSQSSYGSITDERDLTPSIRQLRAKYQSKMQKMQRDGEALQMKLDLQNGEITSLRKRLMQVQDTNAEIDDLSASLTSSQITSSDFNHEKLSQYLTKCRAELASSTHYVRCLNEVCQSFAAGISPKVDRILGLRSTSMSESDGETTFADAHAGKVNLEKNASIVFMRTQDLRKDLEKLQDTVQKKYADELAKKVECMIQ